MELGGISTTIAIGLRLCLDIVINVRHEHSCEYWAEEEYTKHKCRND